MNRNHRTQICSALICLVFLSAGTTASAATGSPETGPRRAVVSRVPPVYPELARRMHIAGTVVLHVVIQPDGSVLEAHVESGHPLLGQAAQQAASHWKFSTSTEQSSMNIEVVFSSGN